MSEEIQHSEVSRYRTGGSDQDWIAKAYVLLESRDIAGRELIRRSETFATEEEARGWLQMVKAQC